MKVVALLVATLTTAAAFAPALNGRVQSVLSAEQKSFFARVAEMDLFAPNKNINDYGAHKKKNLKVGKINKKSYVPAGLSAAEYEKIRAKDKKEKDCKYQENAAKAGEFQDYTEFYVKRGTDTTDKWVKTVSRDTPSPRPSTTSLAKRTMPRLTTVPRNTVPRNKYPALGPTFLGWAISQSKESPCVICAPQPPAPDDLLH